VPISLIIKDLDANENVMLNINSANLTCFASGSANFPNVHMNLNAGTNSLNLASVSLSGTQASLTNGSSMAAEINWDLNLELGSQTTPSVDFFVTIPGSTTVSISINGQPPVVATSGSMQVTVPTGK